MKPTGVALSGRAWQRRIVVLAVLAGWGATFGCSAPGHDESPRLDDVVSQRDTAMRQLREERDATTGLKASLQACTLDESQLTDLRRKGLQDPIAEITADLLTHQELVPPKSGVSSEGRFIFDGPSRIRVLTTNWALAGFGDGLGGGWMLLQYTVRDSARIEWQRLAWALDN